jgi:hypothetical protein
LCLLYLFIRFKYPIDFIYLEVEERVVLVEDVAYAPDNIPGRRERVVAA